MAGKKVNRANYRGKKIKSIPEMKKELVARQMERPDVVDRSTYEAFLDKTLLHRLSDGLEMLDEVKKSIAKAEKESNSRAVKSELRLSIQKVDDSIVALEYGELKYNAPHPAKRMIMWPVSENKKKK